MEASSVVSSETAPSKRLVAKRACLACREKKIKCDGEAIKKVNANGTETDVDLDKEKEKENLKEKEKDKDQEQDQEQEQELTLNCTNCKLAGIKCVFVQSKRGGRRRKFPSITSFQVDPNVRNNFNQISKILPDNTPIRKAPYNFYDYYSGFTNNFHHGLNFRNIPPPHPHLPPHEFSNVNHVPRPLPPGLRPIHPLTSVLHLSNNSSNAPPKLSSSNKNIDVANNKEKEQIKLPPITDKLKGPESTPIVNTAPNTVTSTGPLVAAAAISKSAETSNASVVIKDNDKMEVDETSTILSDDTYNSNSKRSKKSRKSNQKVLQNRSRSNSMDSVSSCSTCSSDFDYDDNGDTPKKLHLDSPSSVSDSVGGGRGHHHHHHRYHSHDGGRDGLSMRGGRGGRSVRGRRGGRGERGERGNRDDRHSHSWMHHGHHRHHRHHKHMHGVFPFPPPPQMSPHHLQSLPPPPHLHQGPPGSPLHHIHPRFGGPFPYSLPPLPPPQLGGHPYFRNGLMPPPPPGSQFSPQQQQHLQQQHLQQQQMHQQMFADNPNYLNGPDFSRQDLSPNSSITSSHLPPLNRSYTGSGILGDEKSANRILPLPTHPGNSSISTPSPPQLTEPSLKSAGMGVYSSTQSIAPSDSVSVAQSKQDHLRNSIASSNISTSSSSIPSYMGGFNGHHRAPHLHHQPTHPSPPGPPGYPHSFSPNPYYDYYGGQYNGYYMPYNNVMGENVLNTHSFTSETNSNLSDTGIGSQANSSLGISNQFQNNLNIRSGNNSDTGSSMVKDNSTSTKKNSIINNNSTANHNASTDNASATSTIDWVNKQSELQSINNGTNNNAGNNNIAIQNTTSSTGIDESINDSHGIKKTPIPAHVTEEELTRYGFPNWETTNLLINIFYRYIHLSHLVLPNLELFTRELSMRDDACLLSCMFSVCTKYVSLDNIYKKFPDESYLKGLNLSFLNSEYWIELTDKLIEKTDVNGLLVVFTFSCYYGNDDRLFKASLLIKASNLIEIYKNRKENEFSLTNNSILEAFNSIQLIKREATIRAIWNVWKFSVFRRINFGYPYIDYYNDKNDKTLSNNTKNILLDFPEDMNLPVDDFTYYKIRNLKEVSDARVKENFKYVNTLDNKDPAVMTDSKYSICSMKLIEDICKLISVNQHEVKYDELSQRIQELNDYKNISLFHEEQLEEGGFAFKVINANNASSMFILNLCEIILNFSRIEPLIIYPIKSNQVSQLMLVEDFFNEGKIRERTFKVKRVFSDEEEDASTKIDLSNNDIWKSLIKTFKSCIKMIEILDLMKEDTTVVGPSTLSVEYEGLPNNKSKTTSLSNNAFQSLLAVKRIYPNSWVQLPLVCIICVAQCLPLLISVIELGKIIEITVTENKLDLIVLRKEDRKQLCSIPVEQINTSMSQENFLELIKLFNDNGNNLINYVKLGNCYLDSMADFYGGVKMGHFQIEKIIKQVMSK